MPRSFAPRPFGPVVTISRRTLPFTFLASLAWNAALTPRRGGDGRHDGAEITRDEDVGEGAEEAAEGAIRAGRMREVARADLVGTDGDRNRADGRAFGTFTQPHDDRCAVGKVTRLLLGRLRHLEPNDEPVACAHRLRI